MYLIFKIKFSCNKTHSWSSTMKIQVYKILIQEKVLTFGMLASIFDHHHARSAFQIGITEIIKHINHIK
ncbi:hypothetical protein VCR9J2_960136 [Vibrio crassostreae]|nr:hypothetical protein VCR9J2_960136 [Vibrio crassostreae]